MATKTKERKAKDKNRDFQLTYLLPLASPLSQYERFSFKLLLMPLLIDIKFSTSLLENKQSDLESARPRSDTSKQPATEEGSDLAMRGSIGAGVAQMSRTRSYMRGPVSSRSMRLETGFLLVAEANARLGELEKVFNPSATGIITPQIS